MRASPTRILAALAVTGALCAGSPPTARAAGLTESARLLAVYDQILQARFDRASALLAHACPPAPKEACLSLEAVTIWWQIAIDLDSRAHDARLESSAAAAIAAAAAWTAREPRRAEAWFYLAGAYGPLVQLRVARGERLAAARDGNRIRAALEKALSLDPTLLDAKFGIGLYHYYADIVPAAAKMLRWLLLLPGGNRQQGMREMLEARNRGQLLRGEADYQLHWLYLWYEHTPQPALDLLRGLDERYPSNPVFLQRIAEVQEEYLHDAPESAATWQVLLDRVRAGTVAAAPLAEARARLGLGTELDAMFETDRAVEQLEAVVAAAPLAPFGARAHAQVLLGDAYGRLGDRPRAVAAYTAAAAAGGDATPDVRNRARAGLRRSPDATGAQAYRLSLEGWRMVERGDAARGRAALERARGLSPDDAVIAVRYARALLAAGDAPRARVELERVLQRREGVPPIATASACAAYASLLERSGERSRAREYYVRAANTDGGEVRVRADARTAIARLGF